MQITKKKIDKDEVAILDTLIGDKVRIEKELVTLQRSKQYIDILLRSNLKELAKKYELEGEEVSYEQKTSKISAWHKQKETKTE